MNSFLRHIGYGILGGITLSVLSVSRAHADTLSPFQFVFVSPEQALEPNTISEKLTLQAQNAEGGEWRKGEQPKLSATACIALSSSSTQGEFSSSATNWQAVTALSLGTNAANRNFYYKDSASGSWTLSAKVALKPEGENRSCADWPVAEWPEGWSTAQSIAVGVAALPLPSSDEGSEAGEGEENTGYAPPPQTSVSASASAVYLPQIFVTARVPAKGVAGAPVFFEATVLGLKKEPLPNARVIWSFGDGGVAEGKSVEHVYHYPAIYTVSTEAASSEWSATDRKKISIISPQLKIASTEGGLGGFVEIENQGADEIDLSHWMLIGGDSRFVIPKGTVIAARSAVPFPSDITGIKADGESTALLYPNGMVAVAAFELEAESEEDVRVSGDSFSVIPSDDVPGASFTVSGAETKRAETSDAVATAVLPAESDMLQEEEIAPVEELQITPLLAAGAGAGGGRMSFWFALAIGITTLTAGAYIFVFRPRQESGEAENLREEAKRYEIIEE